MSRIPLPPPTPPPNRIIKEGCDSMFCKIIHGLILLLLLILLICLTLIYYNYGKF